MTLIVPQSGDVIGWKKLKHQHIAKLRIPDGARRHNATGRKCRAELAEVLEIVNDKGEHVECCSSDYCHFIYKTGTTVVPHNFEPNRWIECAGGIHFFITREEALAYG